MLVPVEIGDLKCDMQFRLIRFSFCVLNITFKIEISSISSCKVARHKLRVLRLFGDEEKVLIN